ncbi:MAG: AraC family transcriptional regulator [Verrucomicrobiota bacterium]
MKQRVAIIGYDGVAAINIAGPLEVFSLAQRFDGYEILTLACKGRAFVTDSNLRITADGELSDTTEVDTLIIPGGSGIFVDETRVIIAEWLAEYGPRVRRVASICTGVYALAESGLLKGRRVTTHWQRARDLAARFNEVRVEESAIVLQDGRFYTSAGATAGIDLALHLITEDCGKEAAREIAQVLLVYLRRDGGQEQYSVPMDFRETATVVRAELNGDGMSKLARWIGSNLERKLDVETLARRVLLTKWEFAELFKENFGTTPALFIKNARFNEARRRLLDGISAREVAKALKLGDPNYFIQEFRRRFGALPDEYQRRFGEVGVDESTEEDLQREEDDLPNRGSASSRINYRRPQILSFSRCYRGKPQREVKRLYNANT